jgi:hypothetical protein
MLIILLTKSVKVFGIRYRKKIIKTMYKIKLYIEPFIITNVHNLNNNII